MHYNDIIIRPEIPADFSAVETLVREAFWDRYRPGCMEHFVLHCLRKDPAFVPELSLVMEQGGQLIGQFAACRAVVELHGGNSLAVLNAGPLCIAPEFQRQGFGRMLLDAAMQHAAALGFGAAVLEGDPGFYGPSGFVPGKRIGIRYADDPEADYFLVKELRPGFLHGKSGTYRDPEGYFVCLTRPQEFAEFEACFPVKEKHFLPGQLG